MFLFLIPEIEKESSQTSEVIFGIGKNNVVVGPGRAGHLHQSGHGACGALRIGRDFLRMCLAGLGSLGGVEWSGNSAAGSSPHFPGAKPHGTFCILWIQVR